MARAPAMLPDIDDMDFKARLSPLSRSILPDQRKDVQPEYRKTGMIEAARAIDETVRVRGEKKRCEFVLPSRVVEAISRDAAGKGVSATIRLLEILRDAGYPVIREDFVDLRKLPKK